MFEAGSSGSQEKHAFMEQLMRKTVLSSLQEVVGEIAEVINKLEHCQGSRSQSSVAQSSTTKFSFEMQ